MEKENAKIRSHHRTQYAYKVRRILSAVKYSDKRYQKILEKEKEKKEQARVARMEEQRRSKEQNARKKQEWLEEREEEARKLQEARDAGLLSDEEVEFRLDEDDEYCGRGKKRKRRRNGRRKVATKRRIMAILLTLKLLMTRQAM